MKNPKLATRLRTMADKLQPQIDNKTGERLTNTPKRQREAMSARIDGERLQRTQSAMNALADMHDTGTVPDILTSVKTKKQIYSLLRTELVSQGYYHIGDTGEPSDTGPEATALWSLLKPKSAEDVRADELREKIESLQFSKIPGYFPTPPDIAQRMVEIADIQLTDLVLEPSAGSGALIDALPSGYDAPVAVIALERNHSLCEILRLKGFDSTPTDFMEYNPRRIKYDKIVMNPPFEKSQDIDHIRHAYTMLKDGGRIVAICSPGPFFRQDKKAQAFRFWLDNTTHTVEDLPEGSFKVSGTGVNTKLLVIEGPRKATPEPRPEPEPAPRPAPMRAEYTETLNLF